MRNSGGRAHKKLQVKRLLAKSVTLFWYLKEINYVRVVVDNVELLFWFVLKEVLEHDACFVCYTARFQSLARCSGQGDLKRKRLSYLARHISCLFWNIKTNNLLSSFCKCGNIVALYVEKESASQAGGEVLHSHHRNQALKHARWTQKKVRFSE